MREVGCIKEKAVGDDAVEFVLKELLVEIIGVPRRDLDSSASHKHFLHQTDGDAAFHRLHHADSDRIRDEVACALQIKLLFQCRYSLTDG